MLGEKVRGCCKAPVPEDLSAQGPGVQLRPWTKLQKRPLGFLASTSAIQCKLVPPLVGNGPPVGKLPWKL